MPKHRETRTLPYSPEQMFDLVADVERYPEFLPWVVGARVDRRADSNAFQADLLVGFKMIRERYTSQVELDRPNRIDVTYTRGPFRYLENHWQFEPHPEGCRIDFYLDFEFRSRLLQRIMGSLFHEAVKKMVSAFEARARRLYGDQHGNATGALPSERPA
ncbi:MAG: type II toxin-antitoxin system RatA family toxin [Bauldia litoralis]